MDTPSLRDLEAACPERVVVCGDSPSLASDISGIGDEEYIVAADGATTSLLRAGRVPDAIVTDLDGDVDDQLLANSQGTLVFVHAHGDNMNAVRDWVPRFKGTIVGTCQCTPIGGLMNLGGFTDGDRAACIFAALGARRLTLIGFDFANPSKKPGKDPDVKRRKLVWAEGILRELEREGCEIILR
jgi:uncharacterized Rossmann fold enzyme